MAEEQLTIEARGLVARDAERVARIIRQCEELRAGVQMLGLAFAEHSAMSVAIERATIELSDIEDALYGARIEGARMDAARYGAALARGLEAIDKDARA